MGHVTVKAHNAPERSDWRTPGYFLDLVRRVGAIHLDPCTGPENPTGAELFYARGAPSEWIPGFFPGGWLGACGLSGGWPSDGLTFVNPPWGAHLSGPVDPDYQISRKGSPVGTGRGWAARIAAHRGETIALVPTRTDSAWFAALHEWADLRLDWRSSRLGARLQFVDPDTGKTRGGNNSACSVFYRGVYPERFASVFGEHGTLLPAGRIAKRVIEALTDVHRKPILRT